ncbi:hypothetical protein RJ639_040676 [Escallonia herrerae]|uniref:RCC1-like domain-containing protein n=1 Tax=Escallonia herrerae TaxID=1293975 RepID=A0AA88WH32_9ASTE|nr:hypothetical protein RJ639_040676 [Escallonia herrerae]
MAANERANEEVHEQEVWSWGAGTEGQLGTGYPQDHHLPQLLPSLSYATTEPISFLSCGGAHTIALTPGGRVLTWGRSTSGQLGHGDMVNSLNPKRVDALQSFVITHVSAGWNHSGFVSDTGRLFTCGDGSFGQLGHGDYSSRCSPVNVLYFSSRHVEQIACGMRHSLALLKGNVEDHVYGFGSGKRGQLGTSRDRIQSISLPQITLGLEDNKIASISANGDHSAALSADGHLYIWGRGFGSTTDVYCPHRASASLTFTQAALGWNHALLLTGDGTVFMLGGNHHGGLSNPQKTILVKHTAEQSNEALVGRIPNLDGIKVLQVAAGAEHSALVTGKVIFKNGVIMTWGWGEHGQLGLGNSDDQTSPQVVSLGQRPSKECTMYNVYCGSGFTFVTRTI